ncbi:DNA-binding transcriptional regulator, FadR family [Thalassobacillus cyri]|uniref:DNA-binding transcriptional regulator, FadR family n=1 Tax=Thalassobacillus cyri TaxID=571932 RepID=A0A1H4AGD2_9BACI|nr:FadR/GntR family transcriptional regulator [Thalassobacillus cyri]SEA34946.1 DNA-binding transcriptional regulator, FadR family [Thalassobacillus cyri]
MVIAMALKPIRKKRLFEEIILAIEEYIHEEGIRPGERLPSENELSTIFQVSKTAVREAMSVLHANGVIEKRTGAGIFLKELYGESIAERVTNNLLDRSEMQEVLEFRRGMEVEAVALAAIRATDKDIEVIRQAHQNLVDAHKAGSLGLEEDYIFHYSIILASHNSIYKDVFDRVSNKFEEVMRVSKMQSSKVPGRFIEAYKEHEQILNALQIKDPQAASEAMRHHLTQNEKKIWANIKQSKEPM